jgi:hypothetical protein
MSPTKIEERKKSSFWIGLRRFFFQLSLWLVFASLCLYVSLPYLLPKLLSPWYFSGGGQLEFSCRSLQWDHIHLKTLHYRSDDLQIQCEGLQVDFDLEDLFHKGELSSLSLDSVKVHLSSTSSHSSAMTGKDGSSRDGGLQGQGKGSDKKINNTKINNTKDNTKTHHETKRSGSNLGIHSTLNLPKGFEDLATSFVSSYDTWMAMIPLGDIQTFFEDNPISVKKWSVKALILKEASIPEAELNFMTGVVNSDQLTAQGRWNYGAWGGEFSTTVTENKLRSELDLALPMGIHDALRAEIVTELNIEKKNSFSGQLQGLIFKGNKAIWDLKCSFDREGIYSRLREHIVQNHRTPLIRRSDAVGKDVAVSWNVTQPNEFSLYDKDQEWGKVMIRQDGLRYKRRHESQDWGRDVTLLSKGKNGVWEMDLSMLKDWFNEIGLGFVISELRLKVQPSLDSMNEELSNEKSKNYDLWSWILDCDVDEIQSEAMICGPMDLRLMGDAAFTKVRFGGNVQELKSVDAWSSPLVSFDFPLGQNMDDGYIKGMIEVEDVDQFELELLTRYTASHYVMEGEIRSLNLGLPSLPMKGKLNVVSESWFQEPFVEMRLDLRETELSVFPEEFGGPAGHFSAMAQCRSYLKLGLASGWEESFDFRFHDGFFSTEDMSVMLDGLSLQLHSTALSSMKTGAAQRVSWNKMNLDGVSLGEGALLWQWEEEQRLFIESMKTEWCGGKVQLLPMRLNFPTDELALTLYCESIQLDQLLQQFQVGDVEGQGDLGGRLSIQIKDGQLDFDDAYLYTAPAKEGSLKLHQAHGLDQAAMAQNQLMLVRECLKDYRYRWARIGVDTDTQGLVLRLQMDGRPAGLLPFRFDVKTAEFVYDPNSAGVDLKGLKLNTNFRSAQFVPMFHSLMKWGEKMEMFSFE